MGRCLQQQSKEFLFEDEDCEFIIMNPALGCKKLSLNNIKIRSIALFISFSKDAIFDLDDDQFHTFGFHPIFRDFSDDSNSFAIDYVQYYALNCWANGWKIVVIASSHSRFCEEITRFIREIRKVCDNLTLDIVIIQPKNNENSVNEDKENNNYIKNFHTNASPTALISYPSEGLNILFNTHRTLMIDRNASDEIRFYNKKEPYYEFTNFFHAPIRIDYKEWKTSESYC
ncbi:2864_t:CDS:2 [Cetraspora pellucida]|uniref:2864_t:CDS:1 n=1 Tax=Cetraspora pellucida TaxID=1433469 RepID=A0A9N9G617_9GLOM|nr:2864_t:CDS:2 [Cetraspora pellucida]